VRSIRALDGFAKARAGRSSFPKKRLLLSGHGLPPSGPRPKNKSFLVLFFKKEHASLPSFAFRPTFAAPRDLSGRLAARVF
jgi:hypothetical protein